MVKKALILDEALNCTTITRSSGRPYAPYAESSHHIHIDKKISRP